MNPGFYGEAPDLTTLDRDDNLIATMHMNDYYATIAEGWFDVPKGDVISGGSVMPAIFNLT